MIKKVLADSISDIFGKVTPPISGMPVDAQGNVDAQAGVIRILNVGLGLVIVLVGIFALWNLISAGFNYVTAGGDSKKIEEANKKITYTFLGLLIVVIAPVLAAVFGIIIFGRWDAILNPDIKKVVP